MDVFRSNPETSELNTSTSEQNQAQNNKHYSSTPFRRIHSPSITQIKFIKSSHRGPPRK